MNKLTYWLPVACWMILIFIFSSRQRIEVSDIYSVNFIVFKTLHIIEYAILYILSFRAMKYSHTKINQTQWARWALVITLLYAASDEIHQTFVPTREGRLRDVIIDGLGGGLGWYTIERLLPRTPTRLRRWARIWGIDSEPKR